MTKPDLTTKFIFYMAVTLIGVIGSMNFWFYNDHSKHLEESLENRANAKLDFLESSTSYYIQNFEFELIAELGKKTMLTDDIVYLSINNPVGKHFFEAGHLDHKDVRFFLRKIGNDGENSGTISIAFNIQEMISENRRTMIYTIGLMVISVLLILGMMYLFYYKKILSEIDRTEQEKDFFRDEYEFFTTIINTSSNLVMVLDRQGYIMLANKAFADMLGKSSDNLVEQHISSVIDIECNGILMNPILADNMEVNFAYFYEELLNNHSHSVLTIDRKNIRIEWEFNILANNDGQAKLLVGTGVDITHQHLKQLELDHLAHHDHLTSLPNRILFNDHLQEAFKQARRNHSLFSVLYVDLDYFKPINDRYGHEAGDHVLKTVAQRIRSSVRDIDTVARLGGDEFGMILLDLKDESNIHRIAGKLLDEISRPITYADVILSVGASIGIAFYSTNSKNISELVNQADAAMYRAKNIGKNMYCCYESNTNLACITRLKPEN